METNHRLRSLEGLTFSWSTDKGFLLEYFAEVLGRYYRDLRY